MPATDDLPVALERLVVLGQSPDVNIRPVLLRVVVDMFLQKTHHAPDDLKQFEVIVSHLLDDADIEARLIVADKLSKHPATPPLLLDRFTAEQGMIAVRLYEQAVLDDNTLTAAAIWGTVEVASSVAARRDLPAATVMALADRPEATILRQLAANAAIILERPVFQHLARRAKSDPDAELARLLVKRATDPIDLAPLFAIVSASQRQAIIEAARRLELGKRQWGRLDGATSATLSHMDRLVLCGERDGFELALSMALGVEGGALIGLLHDEGGEILALALAAVGASSEMAARVFILGDPRIGHSVSKVRALIQIVETVSPHAARRLIGAMTSRGADTIRRSAPVKLAAPIRRIDLPAEPARRESPAIGRARQQA